ncbi:MAG: hypothetical protein ACJARN_000351, partial [Arenicella sp.]
CSLECATLESPHLSHLNLERVGLIVLMLISAIRSDLASADIELDRDLSFGLDTIT